MMACDHLLPPTCSTCLATARMGFMLLAGPPPCYAPPAKSSTIGHRDYAAIGRGFQALHFLPACTFPALHRAPLRSVLRVSAYRAKPSTSALADAGARATAWLQSQGAAHCRLPCGHHRTGSQG